MRTKRSHHRNKFMRIITIPIRALGKARDFYVRSMTNYADKFNCSSSAVMGMSGAIATLPRSFSVNSSKSDDCDHDLRELIRAASIRSLPNSVDISTRLMMQQQQMITKQSSSSSPSSSSSSSSSSSPPNNGRILNKMPPRSCSVSMGRIDEEKPSVFGDESVNNLKQNLAFPRSRSFAANKKSLLF